MKNIFLCFFIALFFISCTSNIEKINLENKKLEFINTKPTFSSCTTFSYYANKDDINYGKLYIEYIDLSFNCHYNGYVRGYFEELFKNTFKLKSMKIVQSFDFSNYEFRSYKINDEMYIDLIYNYGAGFDTFILDYKGLLSQELIQTFNKKYKNKYINEKRFNKEYKKSLVQNNFFNSYFQKERIDYHE